MSAANNRRELDAGQGEPVPVFEEVLDAVGSPVQAEIKDVAAARALAEVMQPVLVGVSIGFAAGAVLATAVCFGVPWLRPTRDRV